MGSGASSGQGSPSRAETVAETSELAALLKAYKVTSPEDIAGTLYFKA